MIVHTFFRSISLRTFLQWTEDYCNDDDLQLRDGIRDLFSIEEEAVYIYIYIDINTALIIIIDRCVGKSVYMIHIRHFEKSCQS